MINNNSSQFLFIQFTGVLLVHNVLEDQVTVILVNARYIKNVPGRKTDVADSQWPAGLLRLGLLKSSFLPLDAVQKWHGSSNGNCRKSEDLIFYHTLEAKD